MSKIETIDIQQEVEIKASPARVFTAISEEHSFWVGPPFTHSDKSTDLKMELFPGGRFYEPLPGGNQGYLWGHVGALVQNVHLEIWGPLGMPGAVFGRVTYELTPTKEGTLVKLKHQAMGQISNETKSGFTFGWKELLHRRLKSFVEHNEILGIKANKV